MPSDTAANAGRAPPCFRLQPAPPVWGRETPFGEQKKSWDYASGAQAGGPACATSPRCFQHPPPRHGDGSLGADFTFPSLSPSPSPPSRSHPSFKHLIQFAGSVSSEELFYFVIVSLGSVMGGGGGVSPFCACPSPPPPPARL